MDNWFNSVKQDCSCKQRNGVGTDEDGPKSVSDVGLVQASFEARLQPQLVWTLNQLNSFMKRHITVIYCGIAVYETKFETAWFWSVRIRIAAIVSCSFFLLYRQPVTFL